LYILYIRLGFNSKIVNNCTNDNELILPTMTDKRQTRPLVREGAPHGQDSNFQQEETSGHESQLGLDTKTDRQTDRLTVSRNVTLILMDSSVEREPPFREDLSPEAEE
jgi:hypothetical protein